MSSYPRTYVHVLDVSTSTLPRYLYSLRSSYVNLCSMTAPFQSTSSTQQDAAAATWAMTDNPRAFVSPFLSFAFDQEIFLFLLLPVLKETRPGQESQHNAIPAPVRRPAMAPTGSSATCEAPNNPARSLFPPGSVNIASSRRGLELIRE